MKARERVTLKKLAEILGLDVSSVSLALRDSPKISAATKRRIHELAGQYRYSPNMAARQLRCTTPRLVGLVLPATMISLADPMAGKTIQLLAEQCTAKGIMFQILSAANLDDSPKEPAVSSLLPEALFIWGDVPRQIVDARILQKRPVIVLDPNHLSYSGYSGRCVMMDNFAGGVTVARHFLGEKALRLLLVQFDGNHLGHKARLDGASQEWLGHRPADSLHYKMLSQIDDKDLVKFARKEGCTIFCSNDWCALQVWHRLVRLGVKMPDDVRLAGFDGIDAALLAGITTIIFDWQALANAAIKMMFQLISAPDDKKLLPVCISIPVFLHKGRTT